MVGNFKSEIIKESYNIKNIGLSVIYFEKQCFLQLYFPKILQTIVSCQTRQLSKSIFLIKSNFSASINMLLFAKSLFLKLYV